MKTTKGSNTKPLISVVLAVRNESVNISRALDSLNKQTYPNVEIIIIDNSTDGGKTISIAQKYGVKVYSLPTNDSILNPRGAQINLGVKKTKGSIIFFPDADMTFDEGLLMEVSQKMSMYDSLYIPEIIIGRGFFGEVRNYERSFYDLTPIDAIRIVKKNIFEKARGFDDKNIRFGADDWDFSKSIKKYTNKISSTTNKLYHHEHILSLAEFIKKKHNYASIFDEYIAKWGRDDPDVKKQLGLSYRAFIVFVENGKWKRILTKPHLFLSVGIIRFITWISYKYKSNFFK